LLQVVALEEVDLDMAKLVLEEEVLAECVPRHLSVLVKDNLLQ
jgi:hypothetical protein